MFAKLTGILDFFDADGCIVNVNGVGYLVHIPQIYTANFETNQSISLFIQTIVKEDSIALYGFFSNEEKKLFNLLLSVQGVGAKIALNILSKISLHDLQSAILLENTKILQSIPGIGAKVALRIVNELKDKINKIENPNMILTTGNRVNSSNLEDAMLALQNLGYSKFELQKIVAKLGEKISNLNSSEDIIKEILQHIAKGL